MIDWWEFETGVTKTMKLSNWRHGSWFSMPSLRFGVTQEDSEKVSKVFSTTSKRQSFIHVSILRMGEGLNTFYEVENV